MPAIQVHLQLGRWRGSHHTPVPRPLSCSHFLGFRSHCSAAVASPRAHSLPRQFGCNTYDGNEIPQGSEEDMWLGHFNVLQIINMVIPLHPLRPEKEPTLVQTSVHMARKSDNVILNTCAHTHTQSRASRRPKWRITAKLWDSRHERGCAGHTRVPPPAARSSQDISRCSTGRLKAQLVKGSARVNLRN